MSTASRPAPPPLPTSAPTRGWLRRNWKWFFPGTFLVAILLGAIAVFGYVQIRSSKYRANSAYQMALAEVRQNAKIQERLGEPIVDSDWNPQGDIDVTQDSALGGASFNFTVSGPEGSADIATDARMVDGEWGLTRLEVRFPDGERVNLSEEVFAKQKVDTPTFDLQAEAQRKSKAVDASEDVKTNVDVDVPDLPPGLK
jgi:hypothetical protein